MGTPLFQFIFWGSSNLGNGLGFHKEDNGEVQILAMA